MNSAPFYFIFLLLISDLNERILVSAFPLDEIEGMKMYSLCSSLVKRNSKREKCSSEEIHVLHNRERPDRRSSQDKKKKKGKITKIERRKGLKGELGPWIICPLFRIFFPLCPVRVTHTLTDSFSLLPVSSITFKSKSPRSCKNRAGWPPLPFFILFFFRKPLWWWWFSCSVHVTFFLSFSFFGRGLKKKKKIWISLFFSLHAASRKKRARFEKGGKKKVRGVYAITTPPQKEKKKKKEKKKYHNNSISQTDRECIYSIILSSLLRCWEKKHKKKKKKKEKDSCPGSFSFGWERDRRGKKKPTHEAQDTHTHTQTRW